MFIPAGIQMEFIRCQKQCAIRERALHCGIQYTSLCQIERYLCKTRYKIA